MGIGRPAFQRTHGNEFVLSWFSDPRESRKQKGPIRMSTAPASWRMKKNGRTKREFLAIVIGVVRLVYRIASEKLAKGKAGKTGRSRSDEYQFRRVSHFSHRERRARRLTFCSLKLLQKTSGRSRETQWRATEKGNHRGQGEMRSVPITSDLRSVEI